MGELFPPDSEVQLTEYPLFDSALDGIGISAISNPITLFAGNSGNKQQFTNMQQNAQIPGGGVFFVTGIRGIMFFMSLADTEYSVAYGSITANASCTSTPARMYDLYNLVAYSTQVTLTIDQFPAVIVPFVQLPAGGGISGQGMVSGRSALSAGLPSKEAAGKFQKPLKVGALSAFQVTLNMFSFGKTAQAGAFTGSGQTTTITNDLNVIDQVNQADGVKLLQILLPGYITRKLGGKT